jgi:hypothetical protein
LKTPQYKEFFERAIAILCKDGFRRGQKARKEDFEERKLVGGYRF